MKTNNQQYHNLRRKGWSHQDACMSLGIDPDVAALAAIAHSEAVFNIENARKEMLPLAFDVLKQVLETGERDADRIKAAQIIIQGEGVLPDVNVEEHSERRRKWAKMMAENNIIEVIDENQPKQLMEMAS
jgi:hypothetical protein